MMFIHECKFCSYKTKLYATYRAHVNSRHKQKSKLSVNESSNSSTAPILGLAEMSATQTSSPKYFTCRENISSCSEKLNTEYGLNLHVISNHHESQENSSNQNHLEPIINSKFINLKSKPGEPDLETPSKERKYVKKHTIKPKVPKKATTTTITSCSFSNPNQVLQENSWSLNPLDLPSQSQTTVIKPQTGSLIDHNISPAVKKLHPCKYCGQKYSFQSGLSRHISKLHREPKLLNSSTSIVVKTKKKVRFIMDSQNPNSSGMNTDQNSSQDASPASTSKTAIHPHPQPIPIANPGAYIDNDSKVYPAPLQSPPPPLPSSGLMYTCLRRRCTLTFPSEFEYWVHAILEHLPLDINTFECGDCREIVDISQTEYHVSLHHPSNVYQCHQDDCKYRTAYAAFLEQHLEQNHKSGSQELENEIEYGNDGNRFECTVCQLAFHTESELDQHAFQVHQN